MSDFVVVCLCLAAGVAAVIAIPIPLVFALIAIAIALFFRNGAALFVACIISASALSAHAWQKLDAPQPEQVVGVATLQTDPVYMFGAQRATASIDGRRYQLWVREDQAIMRPLLAGDRIRVEGTPSKLSGLGAPSQRRKHVSAKLDISSVAFVDHGNKMARFTNSIHRSLLKATAQLPQRQGALAMGMTIGDDRNLDAATVAEFRNANLAHLTAVSGANVAFFIVLFAPLLLLLQLRSRVVVSVVWLIIFGVLTRWEASVVRAEIMAVVALIAYGLGRPISALRAIALGSLAAILIDPFLVGSIGFLLSVSACFGMAILAPMIAKVIVGPKWFRQGVGFAVAAQLGVAPIQVIVFGTLPAVGILANVAAGPLAGVLMGATAVAALVIAFLGPAVGAFTLIPVNAIARALLWIAHQASAANWGNWTFNKFILVAIVWSGLSLAASTFEIRGRSSASRLFHQGRRSVAGRPSG